MMNIRPLIPLMLVAALAFTACGNKTQGIAGYSTSQKADSMLDKHSNEYLAGRIDAFYTQQNDSLCCSESYNRLDSAARAISQRNGTVYLDANHWVAGQDIAEDWSYELQNIQITSDSTATAELNIHNFDDQRVIIDLVFERDDWFVDNFHFFYEASDYDADGNPIPGTEGIKELDERKEITIYVKEDEGRTTLQE